MYFAPIDILFTKHDVVEPDLVYIANENLHILTDKNVQGPPDLLAEVLSQATKKRDSELKFALYQKHGVQEYWIVDPVTLTIRVLRLEDKQYQEALLLDQSGILTTPLLPGLNIPLQTVFTS